MYDVLGYYVTCDDAVCVDCVGRTELAYEDFYNNREGFEDWEEPLPIFRDHEMDTPLFCSKCESIIPVRLTPDGYTYIVEQIKDYVWDHSGLGYYIRSVWLEYKDGMTDADIQDILTAVDREEREDLIREQLVSHAKDLGRVDS